MLIYFVVFLLFWVYGIVLYKKTTTNQAKQFFLFLVFFTMTVVLGLRGNLVGEDTNHYLHIFECAEDVSWSKMFQSGFRTPFYTDESGWTDTIETGYLVLCKVIHFFTNNGQVYLFIIAAITCALFAKFIYDNSEDVFFSAYVFLCESLFMNAFNGIRQLLAIAIIMQTYTLLRKGKLKIAILNTLVATTIHNTALIGVIIFPIMMIKSEKEKQYSKFVCGLVIMIPALIHILKNLIVLIIPRYGAYFRQNYWENNVGGIMILWLIELLLAIVIIKHGFKIEQSFKLVVFVLLYIALEIAAFQTSVFGRLAWYFRAYLVLYYPCALQYLPSKIRKYSYVTIYVLLALLFFSYARVPSRTYTFFIQ